MTLRQAVRAIERESRRQHQAALRHQRELARQYREAQKRYAQAVRDHERAEAASDVDVYEDYVRSLVGLHLEAVSPIDWEAVAASAPPRQPQPSADQEKKARDELASYNPGLIDRALGHAKRRRAELEAALVSAQAADAQISQQAYSEYLASHEQWQYHVDLARRVLAQELAAYREVLQGWEALAALENFGIQTVIQLVERDVVQYMAAMNVEKNVPVEELKLTAGGKVSRKKIAAGRYWELCQDHVCSAALRLVADTFALLPVRRVIVNVGGGQVNTATGHIEPTTWLALHVSREAFSRINLSAIDPSNSMANFQCRMDFKKTKGFVAVDAITAADQWVTT